MHGSLLALPAAVASQDWSFGNAGQPPSNGTYLGGPPADQPGYTNAFTGAGGFGCGGLGGGKRQP